MEYRGMKEDERLVSVTPPERDTEGRNGDALRTDNYDCVFRNEAGNRELKQIYLKYILRIQELLLSCLL